MSEQEIDEPEVIEEEVVEEAEEQDDAVSEEEQGDEAEEQNDEIVIDLEEPEETETPEWVKELRRVNREKDKELRELRAKLNGDKKEDALRDKPTLEGHDYDTEAFENDLAAWYDEKRTHDAKHEEARKLQEQVEERWQQKVSRYEEGKAQLGAQDYDDAEATVMQVMDKPFLGLDAPDVRMNVIKNVASDPNAVVYALGKNEAKAKELAEIDDVTAFAYAVGKMEAKMTIKRAGSKPAPERKITSTAPGVKGAVDNTLERLREEAAKTGDFSKVAAYKRQHRG